MKSFLILIGLILFSCASADISRHFSFAYNKDSSSVFFRSIEDSLPLLGYQIKHSSIDTLIARTYIKQGSLSEREILISLIREDNKGKCKVYVKTSTYFRQDTIIEYYDARKGFSAGVNMPTVTEEQCSQVYIQ